MLRHRWLRFSVRGLLLLTAVIAVLLGWTVQKARQQRDAVAGLRTHGYWVYYRGADSGSATLLEWLRRLLGEPEFRDVIGAGGSYPFCFDTGLVHLPELTQVQTVRLDGTQITDAGLVYLEGLTQLHGLNLLGTQITDAGLLHFQNLTQLRNVDLGGTHVTGSGLAHLEGLSQLIGLNLSGTQITDAGLMHLRRLNKLQTLVLMN